MPRDRVDHFDESGKPYGGGDTSYWYNPDEKTWYQGGKGGNISPFGAKAPWELSPTRPDISSKGPLTQKFDPRNFPQFNPSYLEPWLQSFLGQMPGLNQYPGVGQGLAQLYGNMPQGMPQNIMSILGQYNPLFQMLMGGQSGFLSQFQPTYQGNVNYLNQYGLPGSQQLQQQQQYLGGFGQQMLGGGGQYGIGDLLSQVMQRGFPGQRTIEGMVNPMAQYGQQGLGGAMGLAQLLGMGGGIPMSGPQGQANQTLQQLIQGAGVSPEYARAARETIYDPSYEALMGNLNRQLGGQGNLGSGVTAELQRRHERDFNNQLLMQGQNNLQNYLGLGLQAGGQQFNQGLNTAQLMGNLGQQGINNSMGAFNAVPGAFAPYAQLAGNLGLGAMGQGTQNFSAGNALGLNLMQMLPQMAYSGLNQGMGMGNQMSNSLMQLLSTMGGLGNQFYGTQGNLGLGANQIPANLLSSFMGGSTDLLRQYMAQQAQQQAARAAGWGGVAQAGIGALGQIFGRGGSGGTLAPPTNPPYIGLGGGWGVPNWGGGGGWGMPPFNPNGWPSGGSDYGNDWWDWYL